MKGIIEKSDEFKEIATEFRKYDCKLVVNYPYEYNVDYDWVENIKWIR